MRKLLCVMAVLLTAAGCSTTRLARPNINPTTQSAMQGRMLDVLVPQRRIPLEERYALVLDVDKRVRPATIRVCERTFNNPQDCRSVLVKRTLEVFPADEGINAFVGSQYDLKVLGGLVRVSGTDGEIASVLAHEYAHALMGHVASTQANTGLGVLAGVLTGIAVAAASDADAQGATDIIFAGGNVGEQMGALAFSKDMELEADHLGMFILAEAGYDIEDGANFIRRMASLQRQREARGEEGMFGFLSTHPSDQERIENLIATEEIIKGGAQRPTWRPQ